MANDGFRRPLLIESKLNNKTVEKQHVGGRMFIWHQKEFETSGIKYGRGEHTWSHWMQVVRKIVSEREESYFEAGTVSDEV